MANPLSITRRDKHTFERHHLDGWIIPHMSATGPLPCYPPTSPAAGHRLNILPVFLILSAVIQLPKRFSPRLACKKEPNQCYTADYKASGTLGVSYSGSASKPRRNCLEILQENSRPTRRFSCETLRIFPVQRRFTHHVPLLRPSQNAAQNGISEAEAYLPEGTKAGKNTIN